MIRGDRPDGGPGAAEDGLGSEEDGEERAPADAPACLAGAPAVAAWHPATATATTANAAARRRPCGAVPSRFEPDRLILTSSSTMAIAHAPRAARPSAGTAPGLLASRRPHIGLSGRR